MREVIQRVTTGDVHAFREIVRMHGAAVYAFFAGNLSDHHVAEDLAQETFVAAYRNLGTITDAEKMESWLLSIARNKLMSHLRQRYRPGNAVNAVKFEIEHELIAESDRLDARCQETIGRLEECVNRHADDDRALLHARYFDNEAVQDIAKRLSTTVSAISSQLYRLRHQLRACMEGRGQ